MGTIVTASSSSSRVEKLLTAEAVRDWSNALLEQAMGGGLEHVGVNLTAMPEVVGRTLAAIRQTYPDFQIPPYGCWRTFEAGGIDRWAVLAGARAFEKPEDLLFCAADLAILTEAVSVPFRDDWSFSDPVTGTTVEGRDGLAVAALAMFATGAFSSDPSDPLRVDAHALIRLEASEIAQGMQLDPERDGETITSITGLLKRLGETVGLRPDLCDFDGDIRPGHLVHRFFAGDDHVALSDILTAILDALSPMWQGGALLDDVVLGDCWLHSKWLPEFDPPGIAPFHLVAQKMAYSLVEPFAWVGIEVTDFDGLTGLPNLEHTALFLDCDVLVLKDESEGNIGEIASLDRAIELRALTVALMDRAADDLRVELETSADVLPLTCVMEGGTIRAGAEILRKNVDFRRKVESLLAAGAVNWLPFGA